MKIKAMLQSACGTVAQMLFPEDITCLACGNELDGTTPYRLCAGCPIEFNQTFCRQCGRKIANLAELCDQCVDHGAYRFDLARSSVVLDDTAKKLVYAFKYGGAAYLASYFAGFMAETMQENNLTADYITFVPLHKKRQRKRGYNQSELLAKELSSRLFIPCETLLTKVKYTKNLARLSRTERAATIRDTFAANGEKDRLKGKTVLLVDDVFTTGATCDECAALLKKTGAERVVVLTFASAQVKPVLFSDPARTVLKI